MNYYRYLFDNCFVSAPGIKIVNEWRSEDGKYATIYWEVCNIAYNVVLLSWLYLYTLVYLYGFIVSADSF